MLGECVAQYASDSGTPLSKWVNVVTKLHELDTTRVHYVKVPENHIVIDFDMVDADLVKKTSKEIWKRPVSGRRPMRR